MSGSLLSKVAGLKAPTQMFFCELGEIFKNTYVEEYLGTAASVKLSETGLGKLRARCR